MKTKAKRQTSGAPMVSPGAPSARGTINVVARLSAPTTLTYELAAIAYTTAVATLILWALQVFGRR